MCELKCTELQRESLGAVRWPPAKTSQGRSLRSPAEGVCTLGSSVHFSQEVTYPGQVFQSANHRNCRHPHFSFSEGFLHHSSPVKSLPKPCRKLRGKHLLPHAGIIWELYSSTDHLGTTEPTAHCAQSPAC